MAFVSLWLESEFLSRESILIFVGVERLNRVTALLSSR